MPVAGDTTGAVTAAKAAPTPGVPATIWAQLLAAGASAVQAAAIMGNMMAESGLNPEAAAVDSNGYKSYGLIQWNAASYPSAPSLVTGNILGDIKAQIVFLAQTGGFKAAAGSTPAEAASNFAHTYERCAACGYQGGSGQLAVRSANATKVATSASSNNWTGITASSSAGIGASTTSSSGPDTVQGCHDRGLAMNGGSSSCLFSPPGTSWCFTYCEAKGLLGGATIAAGVVLMLVGVIIVARGPIQKAAAGAVGVLPAGGAVVRASRTSSGLGPRRSSPTRRSAGPAPQKQNRALEQEGTEAYDAGYQKAMLDFRSLQADLEPF